MPPLNKPDDYQSIRSRRSSEGSQWPRPERIYVVADKVQQHASRKVQPWKATPLTRSRQREQDIEMGPMPEPAYLRPADNSYELSSQKVPRLPPATQNSTNPPPLPSKSELRLYARECRHQARNSLELRGFRHPERMHHTFLPRLRIPSLPGGPVQQVSRPRPAATKDLGKQNPNPDDDLSRSARRRWFEEVWPSPRPLCSLPSDARALLRNVLSEEQGSNPCEVAYDFIMTWRRGTIFGVSAIDESPLESDSQAYANGESCLWPSPFADYLSCISREREVYIPTTTSAHL